MDVWLKNEIKNSIKMIQTKNKAIMLAPVNYIILVIYKKIY